MKKIIVSLLALALVISMAACGTVAENSDAEKTTGTVPETSGDAATENVEGTGNAEQPETETAAPETETTVPETEATEPAEPTEPAPYMDELEARYWADSPNGSHIREIRNESGEKAVVCINGQGYITVTLDAGETALSGVYEGAFVTSTDSTVRIRSAKDGAILFEETIDENMLAVPADAPFPDGVALYIVRKNESYKGVTYEIGFVDVKGHWVMEMTDDCAMFDYIAEGGSLDYFGASGISNIRYCGENTVLFYCSDYVCRLYNIKNDQVYDLSAAEAYYVDTDDSMLYSGFSFENGRSDPILSWDHYVVIYPDGTVQAFPSQAAGIAISGDEPYYDEAGGALYFLREEGYGYEEAVLMVTDNTGRIIKKHQGVNAKTAIGFLENKTAPVIIENQEGSLYYTLVGLDGEFLFEPVKTPYKYVVDAQTGAISDSWEYGLGWFVVIDGEGNQLLAVEECPVLGEVSVRNGILAYDIYENGNSFKVYLDLSK